MWTFRAQKEALRLRGSGNSFQPHLEEKIVGGLLVLFFLDSAQNQVTEISPAEMFVGFWGSYCLSTDVQMIYMYQR